MNSEGVWLGGRGGWVWIERGECSRGGDMGKNVRKEGQNMKW